MKTKHEEPTMAQSKDSHKGFRNKPATFQELKELHQFYLMQEIYRTHVRPNEPLCSNDRMANDLGINRDDLEKYLFENHEIPENVAERVKQLHHIKLKNVDMKKSEIAGTG